MGLFMAKGGLGVSLIVVGAIAKNKDRGPDTYGPPYFIGAFITGVLSLLTGLSSLTVAKTTLDTSSQSSLRKLAGRITYESRLTYLTMVSCVIGIVLVSISGLKGCNMLCNFSTNVQLHLYLAKLILAGLIIVTLLGFFTIYLNCGCSLISDVNKAIGNRAVSEDPPEQIPSRRQLFTPVTTASSIVGTNTHDNQHTTSVTSFQHDDEVLRLQEENRRLREHLGQPNFDGHTVPPPSYSEVIGQNYEIKNDPDIRSDITSPNFKDTTSVEPTCGETVVPSAPPCEPLA